jgi:hypothetical protein
MGRFFFIIFTCLLVFTPPVLAQTVYHQAKVTATVLPSPEWMAQVSRYSSVTASPLPFLPLALFTVNLSDGSHSLKNQEIELIIITGNEEFVQTSSTDSFGLTRFILPLQYPNPAYLKFIYPIMGQQIQLNYIYQ